MNPRNHSHYNHTYLRNSVFQEENLLISYQAEHKHKDCLLQKFQLCIRHLRRSSDSRSSSEPFPLSPFSCIRTVGVWDSRRFQHKNTKSVLKLSRRCGRTSTKKTDFDTWMKFVPQCVHWSLLRLCKSQSKSLGSCHTIWYFIFLQLTNQYLHLTQPEKTRTEEHTRVIVHPPINKVTILQLIPSILLARRAFTSFCFGTSVNRLQSKDDSLRSSG